MARDERKKKERQAADDKLFGRGGGKKKRRCGTFAGEFSFGLAVVLACWHQHDMRQHTLSSSFIIHTMNMRYEVTVRLSHRF